MRSSASRLIHGVNLSYIGSTLSELNKKANQEIITQYRVLLANVNSDSTETA